jgi:hypothetical protein
MTKLVAQSNIFYLIVSGNAVADALCEKAKGGVEVRLMVDKSVTGMPTEVSLKILFESGM